MPDIERYAKLDVFHPVRPSLRSALECHRKASVSQPQLRHQLVHRLAQPRRSGLARGGQGAGGFVELLARSALARIQLSKVEPSRIDEIQLGTCPAAGFDDIVECRAVLLEEAEDHVSLTLDVREPLGIKLDAAGIAVGLARELLERVVGGVVQLLQPRDRSRRCAAS